MNHQTGTVVITGASSGIGEDAALHLIDLGYTVFAGVRRGEDGDRLRDRATYPDNLHPILLDVTDPAQIDAARNEVAQHVGTDGLYAFISNAGIAALNGDVSCEGCPIQTQQQLMNINFFGAAQTIQAFLPLIRQARGTIVFNSALMARTVIPFNGGYAASKAALEAWADSLRREVSPLGVRVAIIQAAGIATKLEAKQDPSTIPDDTPYRAQRPFINTAITIQRRQADKPAYAPRRVSQLMVEAITKPKPKPRRITGAGARPIWLIGSLPDRVQDRIFQLLLTRLANRHPG